MRSRSQRAWLAVVAAALATGAAWTFLHGVSRSSSEPSASASPSPGRSAGCGRGKSGGGNFALQKLEVGGRERSYHLRLPDDYVAARAYPLVFRFHGYSGDGLSGGLEIERSAGAQAIVVGVDGVHRAWSPATEANDLSLFDAIYEAVGQHYCVDLARVYVYGFSMGGGMTNLLSCARADKVRASASIAGEYREFGHCPKAVAAWFLHDRDDPTVPIGEGLKARDLMRKRNHCSQESTHIDPNCVRYEGCDPGAPVIWCETRGLGHNIAGEQAPARVWDFFRNLP